MRKPIIGIASRLVSLEQESYLYETESVRQAIIKAGGLPFLILPIHYGNCLDEDILSSKYYTKEEQVFFEEILTLCDGFVLPGGTGWYYQDEIIINYAKKSDKPILGICLGMQELSKFLTSNDIDGKDTSILNTLTQHSVLNHQSVRVNAHTVFLKKESRLSQILGTTHLIVNSRHSYHVENIEDSYVSARAKDGIIEAIEEPNHKFYIGVQWHPENLYESKEEAKRLFLYFVNQCR